jgi:hypothetical protein
MGLFQPVFSTNGPSIEFAVLELLDLAAARAASPATFDDVLGTPFTTDRGDGIGQRNRPTREVTLRAKVSLYPYGGRQQMDQTANDPDSSLYLTLYEQDLLDAGLVVDGVEKILADARLKKLLNCDGIGYPDGTVRVDYTAHGQPGLRCRAVKPGLTGERLWVLTFERIQQSAFE